MHYALKGKMRLPCIDSGLLYRGALYDRPVCMYTAINALLNQIIHKNISRSHTVQIKFKINVCKTFIRTLSTNKHPVMF